MNHSNHLWPGALAGAVAGIVMAAAMMGYMLVRQQSVWTNPNLIAVMWMGPKAASGGFGIATIVGFATHMAASVLMGMMGILFIADLPRGRTVLAALAYVLASYPVAIAFVMTWANPLFVERTQVVPMTMAHIVFGLVYGWTFLALVGRSGRRS
ncbi:MAG: hypothetical protein H0X67_00020 [Acidobacteria bacterium]|nr:hypothetical protein [Acidobacteriota bacterium]